jgi:hypothetical protein
LPQRRKLGVYDPPDRLRAVRCGYNHVAQLQLDTSGNALNWGP